MINPESLLDVLTRFSRTLASSYDVSDVLFELSDSVVAVLGAAAAGVSLADETGTLRFATASNEVVGFVEQVQQDSRQGPCHRAYATNEPVFISDLRACDDWPAMRDAALRVGFIAVAGIPMALNGITLGSLDIYDDDVRAWADDDAAAARVLADIATSYIVHASELEQARRINEQLQAALDSRVLIEQAKGLLAGERHISLDEAFKVLRRHARSHNATVRSVAVAVVELGMRP